MKLSKEVIQMMIDEEEILEPVIHSYAAYCLDLAFNKLARLLSGKPKRKEEHLKFSEYLNDILSDGDFELK